jgi:hypothetical protein
VSLVVLAAHDVACHADLQVGTLQATIVRSSDTFFSVSSDLSGWLQYGVAELL